MLVSKNPLHDPYMHQRVWLHMSFEKLTMSSNHACIMLAWKCMRLTKGCQILHDHTRVRISDRWIYQHPKHISSGVCNLRKLCLFNAKSQPKICKHWIATLEYSNAISIICRMWSNKTNSQINTVDRSRRYNKLSHSHSESGSYTPTNWMINTREYNWNRLRKNPNKTIER